MKMAQVVSQKHLMVQSLLSEIYNRYHFQKQFDSSTETSCFSDGIHGQAYTTSISDLEQQKNKLLQHSYLNVTGLDELNRIKDELDERVSVMSTKLVRQLKQRNRLRDKHKRYCDTITAVLQAVSPKRKVDMKLKFNMEPIPGEEGYKQWCDALRAIIRLPNGLPSCWRKRVWLCLADHYVKSKQCDVEWTQTLSHVFSDHVCASDETLGNQIVKDLHRTGYSTITSEKNTDEDRLLLKRVLLAYARWNQSVGYCQGFNVLAALLLRVTSSDDLAAFKIMVHLIDGVLPENYFANNLQGLSVDMAVFRDILKARLPQLSKHLDTLQKEANENPSGSMYEPPLTNVFTMQWFLTLFATCLPSETILRVWDSIMLDGNEFLLRVALSVWSKLGEKIGSTQSADEFYCSMSELMRDALHGKLIDSDELIGMSYKIAPLPFPDLNQIREKYTYNITPFAAAENVDDGGGGRHSNALTTNSQLMEDLDDAPFFCFTGLVSPATPAPAVTHTKKVANKQDLELAMNRQHVDRAEQGSMLSERMTTDISALKHQYMSIRSRQLQAHLVYAKPDRTGKQLSLSPKPLDIPVMMNHLMIGRTAAQMHSASFNPVPIQEKSRHKRKSRHHKRSPAASDDNAVPS